MDAFKALIEGKNPADFADALKNHDYYIAHGDADTAVPLLSNSQKMADDVGDNIHLQIIAGGVHGTSNFAFYGDIIAQAFADHPAVYTYVLNGLTAGTSYKLSITASDADGYEAVSKTVSFKTEEGQIVTPPSDPSEFPTSLIIGIASVAVVGGVGAVAVWFFVKKKKKFN